MGLPFGRMLPTAYLFILMGVQPLAGQQDLRQDFDFFRRKLPEFNLWLNQNSLEHIFRADSVAVSADKVTLYLRPAQESEHTCAALQNTWTQLEQANRGYNGQYFHERLLHKWAFLAEIHEEQAEVVVRCHEPPHFLARVNSSNGRMPVEGLSLRTANLVQVDLPLSLDGANTGENRALLRNKSVGAVCSAARKYLTSFYATKGTPVLWDAKIDDSYFFVDEFLMEVTHLSHEICPDGYFEYHRIYMKGVQKGADVELSWEFQGKYGSGIIFPPRKNDYKDLDLRYKAELEDYQMRLFRKLLDYLRR